MVPIVSGGGIMESSITNAARFLGSLARLLSDVQSQIVVRDIEGAWEFIRLATMEKLKNMRQHPDEEDYPN
jgi:hypothetical protein